MSKKYYKSLDCGNRIKGLDDLIRKVEKAYKSNEDAKKGKFIFVTEKDYKTIMEEKEDED